MSFTDSSNELLELIPVQCCDVQIGVGEAPQFLQVSCSNLQCFCHVFPQFSDLPRYFASATLPQSITQGDGYDEKMIVPYIGIEPKNPAMKPTNELQTTSLPDVQWRANAVSKLSS